MNHPWLQQTAIAAVMIFRPTKHGDHRGFFSEVYNKRTLAAAGIDIDFGFVQDNHVFSAEEG